MRSDILSQRLFYVGGFGLPWLWIVHVLYWKENREGDSSEGLLNPDDHFHDEPTDISAEEIKESAAKWVNRCRVCSVLFVVAWIAWIVSSQLLRGVIFPATWYMLSPNDSAVTGW